MNRITDAYGKALLETGVPAEDVEKAAEVFSLCPQLPDVLSNPVISQQEKDSVIEKLLPLSLHSFFKVVYRNGRALDITEIFRSYRSLNRRSVHCIKATVEYVTPLTEEQKARLIKMVQKKTGYEKVELSLVHKPELLGGFVLRTGDFRYDRSSLKAMSELKNSLMRREAGRITVKKNAAVRRIRATVEYVTPLTEEQKNRIIELVKQKTGYREVQLNLVENKELIGGFVLRAGNLRYDRSAAGEIKALRKELMRR